MGGYMWKPLSALSCGTIIVLTICAAPAIAQTDAVRAQQEREIAACNRKLQANELRPRVEHASCVNRANAKGWARTPHMDLFENASARELVAAEQFDRGHLTEAEYHAARARIKSELMTDVTKRDAYRAMARPRRGPVTCFTTGGITTCY